MNSTRINGEIITDIRMKVDRKKKCPMVDFLIAAPFSHPALNVSDKYRAFIRTCVYGDNAEWINDNLYEGAHLEIRHGFLQTWIEGKAGETHYRHVGHEIDRARSGDRPEDYEPWNVGRFSGHVRKQFSRKESKNGKLRIGVSIAAMPDMKWYGTSYETFLSVIFHNELAEKIDGKMNKGQTIDYLEGTLQPFRGTKKKVWGLYVIATDIRF